VAPPALPPESAGLEEALAEEEEAGDEEAGRLRAMLAELARGVPAPGGRIGYTWVALGRGGGGGLRKEREGGGGMRGAGEEEKAEQLRQR
jgi:hypothetical protein